MTREVVVIGGGISGLAAAYYLRADGVRVTVLEKSAVIGGVLRVSDVAGLPVDEGAESLLNRRPEAVRLAREVGLGDDIVHPADVPAGVWSRGRIHPLPPGTVMGVPGDPAELTGLLDPDEVERVAAERARPAPRPAADVAVGRLVADRLGAPVVERLVEPFLGGVYAGHADELSLEATVPALAAALRQEPSLLDAVAAVRATAPAEGPVFAGIRGGVGRLPGAVAAASGAGIHTRVTARGLTAADPGSGRRWRVETGPAPRPDFLLADAVVVAVPPAPAARLLADIAPAAARQLAAVEQASVAIVTLALPRSSFPAVPESSGFLVPPVEGRTVKAVTLSSVKWPWLAELAGELVVLRASVGRHRQVADLQRSDDDLVDVVMTELRAALGVRGEPVAARVSRWGGALPQYAVGHLARVARARSAVAAVPGLAVCGASYEGVGVAACVAVARFAATSVLDELGAVPLSRT
ncbi:MAG TPA: protoporphyrinogen oxidase [Jiangellaceae bacterium]|nr:protoporphyrinogen oxidase [Jiangellaceae bacterium]